MNLIFRMLWLLLWQARRAKRIDFLDTSRVSYRAWLSDCDINLHLTNSRYPSFMDLARTYMLAEMGLLFPFLKKRWLPIVNASEFTFIRDIKPLQKFTVESKVVGWDEKYFYIEQRFVSKRGLHCIVHVRGVFICQGKQVAMSELLRAAGQENESIALPPEVVKWKQFLELKKERNMRVVEAA